MQTLENVIDKGSEICGGQNELARRLGMTSGNLSAAKHGRKSLPDEKIALLAELVGLEKDQLWLIAQDARNPFRHAIAACITGIVCGILSLSGNDANAATARANVDSEQSAQTTHCRFIGEKLTRILCAIASSLRRAWPKVQAC